MQISLDSSGSRRARAPLAALLVVVLSACGTQLPPGSETGRHIPAPEAPSTSGIPQVVTPLPLLDPPQPEIEPEVYTVVAQDVPVKELLFGLARDTAINIDVHPSVSGTVSLNAIDQTLPQILERISHQVDIRWRLDESGNLVVEADAPFWRNYEIDYVSVARSATAEAQISTSLAGGAGSNTTLNQTSANDFWATLPVNIAAMLGTTDTLSTTADLERWVVTNPEAGVISVRGTARQHAQVAEFVNTVQTRSLYQVLIEATVVEVNLNDSYQAGVNWSMLGRNNGEVSFVQNVTPSDITDITTPPTSILTIDRSATPDAISATIAMLAQFGELRVLSSPKIMALNNQAAMLRVVNNAVYFTIGVQPAIINDNGIQPAVYTSTATTVPVGFVMTITPQIGSDDQVTLNVRPTISRIVGYRQDPNPAFAENDIVNQIPEIQMSEIESVLKVYSGQVAILGGLMQDSIQTDQDGLPVLSRLPGIRNLFSYRNDRASKTELIIFIRPVVVRQPSITGDLEDYRDFLPANGLQPIGPTLPESALSFPGGE